MHSYGGRPSKRPGSLELLGRFWRKRIVTGRKMLHERGLNSISTCGLNGKNCRGEGLSIEWRFRGRIYSARDVSARRRFSLHWRALMLLITCAGIPTADVKPNQPGSVVSEGALRGDSMRGRIAGTAPRCAPLWRRRQSAQYSRDFRQ